jgi:hypothetical protein
MYDIWEKLLTLDSTNVRGYMGEVADTEQLRYARICVHPHDVPVSQDHQSLEGSSKVSVFLSQCCRLL